MSKVTEIQIVPIKPNNGLVGFASVVVNGEIYLGSIGIHKKLNSDGYRITYPTKKLGEKNVNIYHPINSDIGKEIEAEILKKAEELFG